MGWVAALLCVRGRSRGRRPSRVRGQGRAITLKGAPGEVEFRAPFSIIEAKLGSELKSQKKNLAAGMPQAMSCQLKRTQNAQMRTQNRKTA